MNWYVVDTGALISYFGKIFDEEESIISRKALKIIDDAIVSDSKVKLTIPSVVFIELFEKWFDDEERARKIEYEIFIPLKEKNNIEIRELDKEILEKFIELHDAPIKLETNDKIIFSTAAILGIPLIVKDRLIKEYNDYYKLIKLID